MKNKLSSDLIIISFILLSAKHSVHEKCNRKYHEHIYDIF